MRNAIGACHQGRAARHLVPAGPRADLSVRFHHDCPERVVRHPSTAPAVTPIVGGSGKPGNRRCRPPADTASGNHKPWPRSSGRWWPPARSRAGRAHPGQQRTHERHAVPQSRVHGNRRRGRLVEDPSVVKESQEEVKDVFGGRVSANVAAQKRGGALENPLADGSKVASAISPMDPNSQERNRNGSASSASVLPSWDSPTRPMSASARTSFTSP